MKQLVISDCSAVVERWIEPPVVQSAPVDDDNLPIGISSHGDIENQTFYAASLGYIIDQIEAEAGQAGRFVVELKSDAPPLQAAQSQNDAVEATIRAQEPFSAKPIARRSRPR